MASQYLKGAYSNDLKLKKSRFRLDRDKYFFTVEVVKHKESFPREMMDAPSLETVEVQLNKAEQPDLTQSSRRLCSLQQGWTT